MIVYYVFVYGVVMAKNFIIISLLISFLIFAQEESDPCSTAVAFDMLDAFYDDVKEPTRSSENYKTGEINLIGDDEVESAQIFTVKYHPNFIRHNQ